VVLKFLQQDDDSVKNPDGKMDNMDADAFQLKLDFQDSNFNGETDSESRKVRSNGNINKIDPGDRAFHDWYRFVLSYPPHFVRSIITKFNLNDQSLILDPFCGTGTTLVEAKLAGIKSIGIEANTFPQFVSTVKLDWSLSHQLLSEQARLIATQAYEKLRLQGIDDNLCLDQQNQILPLRSLNPETEKLLLNGSISPLPLHKTLELLDCLNAYKDQPFYRHALLAFANALVFKISNLHFGPEVGVKSPKNDIPVIDNWLREVEKICKDLASVKGKEFPDAQVLLADAREPGFIQPNSVDAVITSPPYPNEKDYTRTTRLESVLLGFVTSREELQQLKKRLVRSNTRGVYRGDNDDLWILNHPEIQEIADTIEKRRLELGKNSGFERMYGRVTKLYFGGMAHHLSELRKVLKPGAQLAYVVGDQASYLRVMIRTGKLLADIAVALGYELVAIDLFRTRIATATKEQLREEVLILRWPG
jgi:hypothetical protein